MPNFVSGLVLLLLLLGASTLVVSLNVVQTVVARHAVAAVPHPLDVAVTLRAKIVTMTVGAVITVLAALKTGKCPVFPHS